MCFTTVAGFRESQDHTLNEFGAIFLAVAVVEVQYPLVKNVRIFIKLETLKKFHKQSNKHKFHVCMHSNRYITKVT